MVLVFCLVCSLDMWVEITVCNTVRQLFVRPTCQSLYSPSSFPFPFFLCLSSPRPAPLGRSSPNPPPAPLLRLTSPRSARWRASARPPAPVAPPARPRAGELGRAGGSAHPPRRRPGVLLRPLPSAGAPPAPAPASSASQPSPTPPRTEPRRRRSGLEWSARFERTTPTRI